MKYRKSHLLVLTPFACFAILGCVDREPNINTVDKPPSIVFVETKPAIQQPINKVLTDTEIQCISDMVYHESRGEGIGGQIAVTHVVLNRMEDPEFPQNACDVIYQRKGKKCQYSWICDKHQNRAFRKTPEYKDIRMLVKNVTAIPDRNMVDPTNGATYFKRYDVKDPWFKKLAFRSRIGNHQFYASI